MTITGLYRPAGGESEDNLIYAFVKCNQYKGDFWPDDEDLALNKRILHPSFDDLTAHIILNEQTGHLEAISETGRFHITLLRLNRPQLVEHRSMRQIQTVLLEKRRLLEQQISELQKTIEIQERYIAMLKAQLDWLE